MPVVLFTCSCNISNSFPEGFREPQRNPGSRGSRETAGRMDAERAPNTQLFLAHAATDLMLRAVRLVLFVFWKQFTNHDKIHVRVTRNLILVHHVYLGFVCSDTNPLLDFSIAKVRLKLPDVVELLLCILCRDCRRHDNILANLPVDGCSNAFLVGSLERVDNSKNLGAVSASACRVHHRQTDLLLGVDDKDGADREGNALLGCVVEILLVDHVIQEGNLSVVVGDDGE